MQRYSRAGQSPGGGWGIAIPACECSRDGLEGAPGAHNYGLKCGERAEGKPEARWLLGMAKEGLFLLEEQMDRSGVCW